MGPTLTLGQSDAVVKRQSEKTCRTRRLDFTTSLEAVRSPRDSLRAAGAGLESPVIEDPHASLRDRVLDTVLKGPGTSLPAIRHAAAEGKGVPADLQSVVEKIHRHAYKVTDDDMARVQAKYGDDQMFEIVVSAALGASRQRLLAGLEALNET